MTVIKLNTVCGKAWSNDILGKVRGCKIWINNWNWFFCELSSKFLCTSVTINKRKASLWSCALPPKKVQRSPIRNVHCLRLSLQGLKQRKFWKNKTKKNRRETKKQRKMSNRIKSLATVKKIMTRGLIIIKF